MSSDERKPHPGRDEWLRIKREATESSKAKKKRIDKMYRYLTEPRRKKSNGDSPSPD